MKQRLLFKKKAKILKNFKDQDYGDNNATKNRIKGYTFAKN